MKVEREPLGGDISHSRRWYAAAISSPRTRRLVALYLIGDLATFVFLMFFDDYPYHGWNWLIAVPVNGLLAAIWPVYWSVLRWWL
jgi:hypothetical protein